MSDWGEVMDRLVVHARTAMGVPAGDSRAERELRPLDGLPPDQWPHAFVHSPAETTAQLTHQQEQSTVTYQVAIATRDGDQEALSVIADAFRDAVRGDRTLGGLVLWAFVSERELLEGDNTKVKMAAMAVETVEEEV